MTLLNKDKTLDISFIRASQQELTERVAPENQEKEGYIAGWASTEALDSYDTVIVAGAFTESIAERGLNGPRSVKLLLHHDRTQVAGIITRLEYVGSRLWMEAQLQLEVGYVRDAYLIAKSTGGLNFSVGFKILQYKWSDDDNDDPTLYITKGDLLEVSVVAFPANEECTMDVIRQDTSISTISDFEKSLVSEGIVKSRNDAKRVTLVVKRAMHIFGSHESLADAETKSNRPRLDEQYAELSKKLDQVRQSVAPEAQT